MPKLFLACCAFLAGLSLSAQNYDQQLSVPLTATVSAAPPAITLHWQGAPQATGFVIHRKIKTANTFFTLVANPPAGDSVWTDLGIEADKSYEYRVQEVGTGGVGYINSGIALAPLHTRGRVILVVDSTVAAPLAAELLDFEALLDGDGWQIARIDVPRTLPATGVKQRIVAAYQQDPANTKALFLFGHVPVPYSGNINPDGHPDHQGAWPCDGYYADMNGTWTDATVNNAAAGDARNHNVPGDGKFDQSSFPSAVELQVGRVDFYNLPAFASDETELLRRYFQKDRDWRLGLIHAAPRGAIDDNFQSYAEGFAQNGWKNFTPLLGADSVRYFDWDGLKNTDYLWAYGCGGGWYQGAGGVITTSQFASDTLRTVFAMLFGSYFGDWDSPDNLLRASLASPGTILTNAWAGRPNWQFHHLGLGETVGYGAFVTMNNAGAYVAGYGGGQVHIALMGDPTLRMTVVPPPAGPVQTTLYDSSVRLDFGDSPDPAAAGYFVYRRPLGDSLWALLTPQPLAESEFYDSCLVGGQAYEYLFRAAKFETTPSGSYWNLSQGLRTDPVSVPMSPPVLEASFEVMIPIGSPLGPLFDATLVNASAWEWDFGDNNTSTEEDPVHFYAAAGTYVVTLTALGSCGQSLIVRDTITLNSSSAYEPGRADAWRIFPNPAGEAVWLENRVEAPQTAQLRLFSPGGQLLWSGPTGLLAPGGRFKLTLSDWPGGVYWLEIQGENAVWAEKLFLKK